MAADLHRGTQNTTVKFEVERKFRVPPNFKEILETKGARLLEETTFTDVYFDAPNHALTLTGCWLRKRDDKWELKIQKLKNFSCGIESNAEFENEREIVNELSGRLRACQPNVDRDSDCSVGDFIQRTCCKQIACYATHRTVYKMPNGVIIDVDQASFGYQVGELEIVVSCEKDVDLAKETIQKTATILGMHNLLASVVHVITAFRE